jgi:hypothetical protein
MMSGRLNTHATGCRAKCFLEALSSGGGCIGVADQRARLAQYRKGQVQNRGSQQVSGSPKWPRSGENRTAPAKAANSVESLSPSAAITQVAFSVIQCRSCIAYSRKARLARVLYKIVQRKPY